MKIRNEDGHFEEWGEIQSLTQSSCIGWTPEEIKASAKMGICFDCGNEMVRLPDAKYCPHCGRFVYTVHGQVK